MFCEKCGKQIPDNSAFCDGCGAKIAPAAAPAQAPAAAPAAAATAAPAKPKIEFNKKTLTGLAVVAAAIVIIILAVVLIANAGGGDAPLLYVVDGELIHNANIKKSETFTLDDEFVSSTMAAYYGETAAAQEMLSEAEFTEDYKKFVYIADFDDGDSTFGLFWVETKHLDSEDVDDEIVKVTSGVSGFMLAEEADLVVYSKGDKLYSYNFKDDPILVSKDVVGYTVTKDGKMIAYRTQEDNEIELHVYTVKDDESEKIDSDVYEVRTYDNDNGFKNMIYTKQDDDGTFEVYTAGVGHEKEKLVSDVYEVLSVSPGKGVFYTEMEDDGTFVLSYYDVGEGEKTELSDAYSFDRYASAKNGVIVYCEVDEEYEETWFACAVGSDPVELDEPVSVAAMDSDGKTLYLVHREADEEDPIGTLVSHEIGKDGVGKSTKLADEVFSDYICMVNDMLLYFVDFDVDDYVATLYHWDGEDVKVADEAYIYGITAYGEKQAVFFTDPDDNHGTMQIYNGKKVTKVGTDIYQDMYSEFNGDLLFMSDFDAEDGGTLNLWDGKDKTKIASDVQAFVPVN